MAQVTLGSSGKFISWLTSLLLLYAILSAYILGNASLLTNLFIVAGTAATLFSPGRVSLGTTKRI